MSETKIIKNRTGGVVEVEFAGDRRTFGPGVTRDVPADLALSAHHRFAPDLEVVTDEQLAEQAFVEATAQGERETKAESDVLLPSDIADFDAVAGEIAAALAPPAPETIAQVSETPAPAGETIAPVDETPTAPAAEPPPAPETPAPAPKPSRRKAADPKKGRKK